MAAKKLKKSTKKFQKNQLAGAIKQRKERQNTRRVDELKKQKVAEARARRRALKDEAPVLDEADTGLQAPEDAEAEDLDVAAFLSGKLVGSDGEDDLSSDSSGDEDGEDGEDAAAASGDESSSSSEDEGEDGEDDEAKLARDMARHKEALRRMAEKDPQFHQHLMKDSAGLLEFGEGGSEDEDEAVAEAAAGRAKKRGAEAEPAQPSAKRARTGAEAASSRGLLTNAKLSKATRELAKAPTLAALRQVVKYYRAACHTVDDEEEQDEDADRSCEPANAAVFNNVVRYGLSRLPAVLDRMLQRPKAVEGASAPALKTLPKWKAHERTVQSYVGSTVHFLSGLVEPAMVAFVLRGAAPLVPYFVPFPKLCVKLARALLKLWSSSETVEVRVEAFLRLRELVIESPPERKLLDQVLKDSYLAYVRNSQFVSAQSMPHIQFMANCIVELYGLDHALSYQHAFVYVRQLAIHVRNAIVSKEKDAHKSVYNWSFVNCLRVWALMLARHGSSPDLPLHALVYPFVQVCLTTVRLVPSSRFFPLRLTVSRLVVDLARETRVFVPLVPELLAVLDTADFKRRPSKSTQKAPELALVVKVSKKVVATQSYQQAVLVETVRLLQAYYTVYSHSVSFPELVVPARAFLKKFAKTTRIQQARKQLQTLMDKLERNAQFVSAHRAKLTVAPKDLKGDGRVAPNDRSPLEKFADLEAEQAKAKAGAPQSLDDLLTGTRAVASSRGGDSDSEDDEEEASSDEDDEEMAAAGKEDEDGEDEEEDEEELASDEEPEDEVQPLVMSDDESD